MDGKHVKVSGPLFDGRADRAVRDFVNDFAEGYAEIVNNELQRNFARSFKNPTGRYESRVRARRIGVGRSQVGSRGVPYASWLEGNSPRNRRSSFKGYQSFAETAVKMDRVATAAANAAFRAHYLRRMS